MTTKLALYNLGLFHLRERKLASLTENREPRRVLDDIYTQVLEECLAEGLWNFAMRAVQQDASDVVTPGFGYRYAFAKADDWVRTVQVASVPTFNPPLLDYRDEGGFLYADWTPLYQRYVSKSVSYGLDLGLWPPNFTAWVAFKLAEYGCNRITGSEDLLEGSEGILRRGYKAKIKAKSTDAMDEPPGQPPSGTWVTSRRGYGRGLPYPGGDRYDD